MVSNILTGNLSILCLKVRGFPSKPAKEKIKYIINLKQIYHPDFIILTETNNIHPPFKEELKFCQCSSNPLIKLGQGIAINNPLSAWSITNSEEAYVGRKLDLTIKNEQSLPPNSNFRKCKYKPYMRY
jgi:hypothetical protein